MSYTRLTKKQDGVYTCVFAGTEKCQIHSNCEGCDFINHIFMRLGEFEDLYEGIQCEGD